MPAKVYADSISSDGKAVDIRFVLSPASVTKELNLTSSATSVTAMARIDSLAKHFSNKVIVISLGQVGKFGLPVEIIVKIDLTLNQDALVLYSYSKATSCYKKVETQGYWADKNDYFHFTTQLAGDVVITDRYCKKNR